VLACSVAAEKASNVASHNWAGDSLSGSQSRRVISPICGLVSSDEGRFQAFCRDALVKAGGRSMSEVRDGEMSPSFSAQLEDWDEFQHLWQWNNRGKDASQEGLPNFLLSWRKRHMHQRRLDVIPDPTFPELVKSFWHNEETYLELSGKDGFAAYMQAVKNRLASHHFTQPFQLAEDPRQQDPWTTWVEYLSYNYWRLDMHVAVMRAAKPQYKKARDELQRFDMIPLHDEPDAAQLEMARQLIHESIKYSKPYLQWETVVIRQEMRAQWVLEQLPLIDTVSSAENEATQSSSSAKRGMKRKLGDGHDDYDGLDGLLHQRPKREGQDVGHSG
jgi:hypothetical protein